MHLLTLMWNNENFEAFKILRACTCVWKTRWWNAAFIKNIIKLRCSDYWIHKTTSTKYRPSEVMNKSSVTILIQSLSMIVKSKLMKRVHDSKAPYCVFEILCPFLRRRGYVGREIILGTVTRGDKSQGHVSGISRLKRFTRSDNAKQKLAA